MTLGVYIILGILSILILCVLTGLWIGLRDEEHTFTVTCPECNGDDIKESLYWRQCQDCGNVMNKTT